MSSFRDGTVLRKYAGALLAAAEEQGCVPESEKALNDLSALLIKNRELYDVICAPTVRASEKKSIIDDISGGALNGLVRNTLFLMIDNGRSALIPHLAGPLAGIREKEEGRVKVSVTTAFDADETVKKEIGRFLELKLPGKKYEVSYITDRELIGGFTASFNNTVYDCSIAGSVYRLAGSLM